MLEGFPVELGVRIGWFQRSGDDIFNVGGCVDAFGPDLLSLQFVKSAVTEHGPGAAVQGGKFSLHTAVLLWGSGCGVFEGNTQTVLKAVMLKLLIFSCVVTSDVSNLYIHALVEMLDEGSNLGA